MARVPTVSEQVGGGVRLDAPGVVPVQDQTGAQIQQAGRAVQFAGQGIQRLGDDIRERNDVARISEADSLFGDFVRQRLNPKDGYRSLRGRAAGDSYDGVRRELEEKRDAIARTLQTDDQRNQFKRAATARASQAQGIIDSHAARETSIYEATQHAAAVAGFQADYVENLGNPRVMATSMARMQQSIEDFADAGGVSPEQRKQMHLEATTGMHATAIDGLIANGDSQGARDYLNANSKAMSVDQRNKAQRIVKSAGIADKGQRTSEFIQTKGSNYLERVEMLDAMHERGDISIEVRDNAASRLRTATKEQREMQAHAAKKAMQDVSEWVAAGNEPTPQMLEALDETKQRWKFDAIRANGGLRITTKYGHRALYTNDDTDWAQFKSADEVWTHFETELSGEDLPQAVARWSRAMVRIGTATKEQREAAQQDLIKVKFADAAAHHFRRLPGVADEQLVDDFDEIKFANWSRSLRQEAESLAKQKGLTEMNAATIDEAADQLLNPHRLPIEVDGERRVLAGLTPSEVEKAKLVLPDALAKEFGSRVFDLNLVSREDLNAARVKLNEEVETARRTGDTSRIVTKITERTIYLRAIQAKVEADKAQKREARVDVARGYRLASERFLGMMNDPDVLAQLRDPFRDRKGSKTVFGGSIPDYRIPDSRTREEELVSIAFERFGADLANTHGISFDDLRLHLSGLVTPNSKAQFQARVRAQTKSRGQGK